MKKQRRARSEENHYLQQQGGAQVWLGLSPGKEPIGWLAKSLSCPVWCVPHKNSSSHSSYFCVIIYVLLYHKMILQILDFYIRLLFIKKQPSLLPEPPCCNTDHRKSMESCKVFDVTHLENTPKGSFRNSRRVHYSCTEKAVNCYLQISIGRNP